MTGEDLHNSVEDNLVIIEPVNEVHAKVIADNGIKQELVDFFTLEVPGANAITGMEEPEEGEFVNVNQIKEVIDKMTGGEENTKLDEIMDELNDPNKKITFH